jgi:PHD/YefM family antitoxin component YafN of YafNO toxin-antitoxin module
MCHDAEEPIFVTKNGYGDMVVMSMEVYQRAMYLNEVYAGLAAAEAQVTEDRTIDAGESLRGIRSRYHV